MRDGVCCSSLEAPHHMEILLIANETRHGTALLHACNCKGRRQRIDSCYSCDFTRNYLSGTHHFRRDVAVRLSTNAVRVTASSDKMSTGYSVRPKLYNVTQAINAHETRRLPPWRQVMAPSAEVPPKQLCVVGASARYSRSQLLHA